MEITKQQQIIAQCNAVNHLATQIACVHAELAATYAENIPELILNQAGARTALLMDQLGDVLNGMDAVDPNDAWLDPIFERAQAMFPNPIMSNDVATKHPEDRCDKCFGPNIKPWFAPSPLWNKAVGDDRYYSILCPQCFVALAREAGIDPVWRLAPEGYTGPDDDPLLVRSNE